MKIWQYHLLLNPFHMVDAKFDLVLRPISHGNLAAPFWGKIFLCFSLNNITIFFCQVSVFWLAIAIFFMAIQTLCYSKKKLEILFWPLKSMRFYENRRPTYFLLHGLIKWQLFQESQNWRSLTWAAINCISGLDKVFVHGHFKWHMNLFNNFILWSYPLLS